MTLRSLFPSLLLLLQVLWGSLPASCDNNTFPIVINTWPFVDANLGAVATLKTGGSHLDAVEKGCSICEEEQCDGSVGYGGSPDESGETTLDAMIMDGETHDVGSVGALKQVKNAISVARSVMEHTEETLLVGLDATQFAMEMGFQKSNLSTNHSLLSGKLRCPLNFPDSLGTRLMYQNIDIWKKWVQSSCQPNYWIPGRVSPDPTKNCGPYKPVNQTFGKESKRPQKESAWKRPVIDRGNHDTIGMVVIDIQGRISCGTSTNGANHKIDGRVGDSPITGAGCYVDKQVGGAAATGDGDVMMRFLPTYQVVESMRHGMSPTAAAEDALHRIAQFYPNFTGALIALNITGGFGAANHGFASFTYTVYTPQLGNSTVFHLP